MKERPILFSGPMIRAIQDGRKSQTRRIISKKIVYDYIQDYDKNDKSYGPFYEDEYGDSRKTADKCKYGKPGDRLWVKESWYKTQTGMLYYKAEPHGPQPMDKFIKWKSARFMFKKYARIWCEITDIRVERVQDISASDAIDEGILTVTKDGSLHKYCIYDKGDYSSVPWQDMPRNPMDVFQNLWDSINKKRGYGWDANPWIWVIEFKIIKEAHSETE